MADRTHSHDTSTPAMSAETVPSEEFVLVPLDRGPTFSDSTLPYDMISAGMEVLERADDDLAGRNGDDTPDWDYGMQAVAVYRAMIAAAPTLSASHFAKEGGEAGAVERLHSTCTMGVGCDTHGVCFADANGQPDQCASLSQPSPALAKGGDAVPEVMADFARWVIREAVFEGSDLNGSDVQAKAIAAGMLRATKFDPAHHEDPWGHFAPGDDWFVFDGPLSTPTEGPAFQTEGMGGDAARDAEAYIQSAVDRAPEPLRRLGAWLADKLDEDDWKTAEQMLLGAALTPPETAEAVPVAYRYWDDVTNRWYLVSHRINAPSDAPCEPLYSRSASSQGGE